MGFSKRSWFPTEFITTVTLKTDQEDSTSSSKFHRSFCTIKTLPFFSSSLGVCVFRFAHIFLSDAVGFTYRRSKSRKNSLSSLFLLDPLSFLAVGPVLPWLSFFLFSNLFYRMFTPISIITDEHKSHSFFHAHGFLLGCGKRALQHPQPVVFLNV